MADIETYDVVIIGGGSGLTAAYYAEKDGRSIALISDQPDALGGTCVNYGCIPTKTLIETARVADTIRDAARVGIRVDKTTLRIDFARIMTHMRSERAKSAASVRAWVEASMTLVPERVRFVGDKLLETASGRQITGERIFIATGAQALIPPVDGLATVGYWTNREVLELERAPASLAIIGGGYIGAELGYFFAAIGTTVTIVNPRTTLLAEDEDIGRRFTRSFGRRVRLATGSAVAARLGERDNILTIKTLDGRFEDIRAEAILVAAGRAPQTDGLELAATGVEVDAQGAIRVDAHLATSHPEIYAYGDVIGTAPFKHTSSTEGEIAYANAFGADRVMDYQANPHAVFSAPEVAAVGLTEQSCRERGLRYRVFTLAYIDTAKGRIIGAEDGFAKLILDAEDRILGCHILGPEAALLLHEVVVAMNAGDGHADLVRRAIHIHPSLSEIVGTLFDQSAG